VCEALPPEKGERPAVRLTCLRLVRRLLFDDYQTYPGGRFLVRRRATAASRQIAKLAKDRSRRPHLYDFRPERPSTTLTDGH